MRRNFSIRTAVARSALLVGLILGAGPALALPANFSPSGGFDTTNLGGLPTVTIGAEDAFVGVGEGAPGAFDVNVEGSMSLCILFNDDVCRANTGGINGPFSVIMTLTVTAVNTEALGSPFTIFLSALSSDYAANEVAVELDPTLPADLDTTAVPDFVWNESFSPAVRVTDALFGLDYVGYTVDGVGDSLTLRYDVSRAPTAFGTPQLSTNATSAVIPEPGTALLMGLGLAGLAFAGRPVERRTN
ncbi:MAG: PEP-CTERM sorting domain-containing protein [bacterium]|nr:PEP-CTERM sorting domain-containing protein [bacterium]